VTSTAGPDIELRGVSFAYDGVPVLEDVDLTIQPREAVCIVGPNGGGKTTLVKLMLGLLKPDRGEVLVFGRSPGQSRLRIGYMPQYARHDLQFPATVTDVVLMGRLGRKGVAGFLGLFGKADRDAAREALGRVGMDKFARQPFSAISGGQRQRVLIARALCCQPDLLVLDEPTANVDILVESQLSEVLKELNQRMTILLVSHDLGFVSHLVETVVCVNRTVVVHPTSELDGDAIRDVYGGEVRIVRHGDVISRQEDCHD